jgi:regulatory protein
MIRKTAYRLLARRSYSSSELRKKLKEKGFSSEIEPLIEELTALGFLQDEELLVRLIELEARKGRGRRWIVHKLKERGFTDVEGIVKELVDERKAVANAFEKGGDRKKIAASLYRKGFDPELLHEFLRNG